MRSAKRWVLRTLVHGKRRDIGLGGLRLVSLAEAREMALAYRKLARQGGDPVAERRKERRLMPTFEEAARAAKAVASEHRFALLNALATTLDGWADAFHGQVEPGVAEIRRGLALMHEPGRQNNASYFPALLAEALATGGQALIYNDRLLIIPVTEVPVAKILEEPPSPPIPGRPFDAEWRRSSLELIDWFAQRDADNELVALLSDGTLNVYRFAFYTIPVLHQGKFMCWNMQDSLRRALRRSRAGRRK